MNLVFNFTNSLEAVNITTAYGSGDLIANDTLSSVDAANLQSGDYSMRNTTLIEVTDADSGNVTLEDDPLNDKNFEVVINGKNSTRSLLSVKTHECILGYCIIEKVSTGEIESSPRMWSDKDSWGGTLPVDGDDVVIDPTWWVELDLAETPKLNSLEINGRLTFKRDTVALPKIKL